MADPRSAPSRTAALLCPTVLGRDRELRSIRDGLADAQIGHGGTLVLVGEAGIGKSRLTREAAAAAAERGMAVLRGRAVQAASPVPYRPFAEALCHAVRSGGPPESPVLAPFRAALGRLVPEWRDEQLEHADESVVVLGEAVLRFLRVTAADRGCLVVLEDLHWADPESLMILEYLVDNLASEPVLSVATLRVEDQTPALHLARQLEARRACVVFDLPRLDEAEVERMVMACLDATQAPRDVNALAGRADGVPFLVEELLAATVAAGALVHDGRSWVLAEDVDPVLPLTFADSVRRRLRTFDADAGRVLAAAAVIGRRFDWSLLPRITELTNAAVLGALHLAIDAQIIVSDNEQFLFRHALTRDAVVAELLSPERATLAARALEVIEDDHPGLPGAWCELGAELAEAAGDRERAAALLLEVGWRALAAGALASAERALDRARAARSKGSTTIAIEETLCEVLSLAGKRDRAVEITESLLGHLAEGSESVARRAAARIRLARVAIAATDWPAADEQLDQARADAAEMGDERLTARIDALAAHAAMGEHRPDEAAALARDASATAARVGLPEVECEALEIVGRCTRPYDLDEAERAFARAYAIADEHGLTVWKVRALHELGTIDLLSGAHVSRLEAARELAVSIGALATTAVIDVQLAAAMATRFEPDEELQHLVVAQRAAELARRYGLELTFAAARGFEGHAHAGALRRPEMEECFADATAHAHGDPGIAVITRTGQGFLALAEEDRVRALRELGEATTLCWRSPGDQSTGPSAGMLALVRSVDDPTRNAALPEAPEWWRPVHFLAHAYSGYAEAVILGRQGRELEAADLVAATDAVLQDFPAHRHLGRRLVAEAALADGWGEPIPWLREALGYFEGRGYDRVASACRSLLRRAGAPVPRRREGSDAVPASLRAMGVTARELEVLTLLAEGRSNKEIGARLFLSPRTVERHIANLTAKTGVERRAQLVALAAREVVDTL